MEKIRTKIDWDELERKKRRSFIKFGLYIIGFIFILLTIFGCFYIVSAGERAVLLTFGKPSMNAIGEGLNFKIPFVQKAMIMDVKTQKYQADLTASSRDLQDVKTTIAINYRVSPESTPQIYKTIGLGYADIVIYPLEQEVNKGITAQYTAEELITKREDVRQRMKDSLTEKLLSRGILVEEVSIVNFAFSESFSQAIEAKVTAEQNALQAKNKLEQIKYEAEQTIAKATAEATALRLQKQEITPDLIKLRQIEVQRLAIEKWNGILPQVTGGAIPFISLETSTTSTPITK